MKNALAQHNKDLLQKRVAINAFIIALILSFSFSFVVSLCILLPQKPADFEFSKKVDGFIGASNIYTQDELKTIENNSN